MFMSMHIRTSILCTMVIYLSMRTCSERELDAGVEESYCIVCGLNLYSVYTKGIKIVNSFTVIIK